MSNPAHFHLDVISELNKLWSNAVIDFVQEGSQPVYAFGQDSKYHHQVCYRTSLGSVEFRMEPLPTAFMVAVSEQPPSTRKGDQAQPLAFDVWFERLRNLNDIHHLLPLPPSRHPPFPPHQLEQMVSFPVESSGTVWKHPDSLTLQLPLVRTYLIESLLNAPEDPKRLFFGIEDGTKDVIGYYMQGFDAYCKAFSSDCLAPEIFPTLRPEWFQLVFYEVTDSIPSKWNEPIHQAILAVDEVAAALILAKGRAAFVMPDEDNGSTQFIVPSSVLATFLKSENLPETFNACKSKTILKSIWKHLHKAQWEDIDLPSVSIEPRYVLEIRLTNTLFCGCFFRTELGTLQATNSLRLCFPFPRPRSPLKNPNQLPKRATDQPYTGLDPCAIWRRARAATAFEVSIAELFLSPIFLKILVQDPACDIRTSLHHYLRGRSLGKYETVEAGKHGPLRLPAQYPRLVVASLSNLDVVKFLIRCDNLSSWLVLLFVDTKMADCRRTISGALQLGPSASVIDVRALVSETEPSTFIVPSSKIDTLAPLHASSPLAGPNAAIQFDLLPSGTLNFVTESQLNSISKPWLERQTPSEPPAWEILQAGRIYFTQQAQRLHDEITIAWTKPSPLQVCSIIKIFPVSGATCLLRSVAHKQSENGMVTVLWITSIDKSGSSETYAGALGDQIPPNCTQMLLCTDEIGSKKASRLLQATKFLLSSRPQLRIIWLQLRASTTFPWSQSTDYTSSFAVSPFVDPKDIFGLVNTLKVFGNETALNAVSSKALTSSSRLEDRHMFVFVLAATKGVCIPIEKWIGEVYTSLKLCGQPLLHVALSISFVSAFAVDHAPENQSVYDDPLEAISPLSIHGAYAAAISNFRTLFPSTVQDPKSSVCLHPFLARLFWRNTSSCIGRTTTWTGRVCAPLGS